MVSTRGMSLRSANGMGTASTPQRPVVSPNNGGRITRSTTMPSLAVLANHLTDEDLSWYEHDHRSSAKPRKRRSSSHLVSSHRKPKRARHHSGFYDEDDDERGEEEAYMSPTPDPNPDSRQPTRQSPRTSKRGTASATRATRKSPSKPVMTSDLEHEPQDPTRGIIPPWITLPYFTLVQIFDYAAHPLDDPSAVGWLVCASRTCRAFAEPALTVLYASPPLLTMPMAHNLVALLAKQPSETMFAYRQKIRQLKIDVGNIATLTYRSRVLDLKALIAKLPKLVEVDLFHHKDMSPYRQLDENLKWHYPPSLFEALGVTSLPGVGDPLRPSVADIRLKSWRWSSRMMGPRLLSSLGDLHKDDAFNSLQKVSFVNYQLPSLHSSRPDDAEVIGRDQRCVQHLAACISALPLLTHLVMESSTVVNDTFLPLLPKTLQHLELINCWEVKAEDFSEYLISNGNRLHSLTLHHNQSLSLGFLPVLGVACPNLRHLRMNLTYYNHHEFYNDSDPVYECLLAPSQRPTWPSTLEVVELEHLRKWTPDAAEMFFHSLVDSAPSLPMLRYLSIKAMLDMPWRQRCQIRDRWEAKLKEVFMRKWEEPKPLHSLRLVGGKSESPSRKKQRPPLSSTTASPVRRSNRIATQPSAPSSRASSVVRDLRKSTAARVSYTEPDTDDDADVEDETTEFTERTLLSPRGVEVGTYIQGLCEVVDIRIDNQKPAERQFGMDDFLDSDDASDDEWNGDEAGDDGYAW